MAQRGPKEEPPPPKAADKGLPAAVDVERYVLGSILLNGELFPEAARVLTEEDFTLDKHRRIWRRLANLYDRQEAIDRVTLAHELMRHGELESVDGLSYLASLDDGCPDTPNVDAYVGILHDKTGLRRLIHQARHIAKLAIEGATTPQEIAEGATNNLLDIAEPAEVQDLYTPIRIIEEFEGGVNQFLDPSRRTKGILTGYTQFDNMTNGLQRGNMIIIGGRPSMGKTALALNISQHVVHHQKLPVAVFSLEMSKSDVLLRMIASLARVDMMKIRAGYLNAEERKKITRALQYYQESKLFIDDTSGLTTLEVRSKLLRLQRQVGPLGLVVVDYLQLMSSRTREENRNQEVSAQSRSLKILAKDLNVPMMVLSQLSRGVERRTDTRPQLSDLRESGSIEQDADLVAFVYRPEVYNKNREDLRGLAEIIIAKQRNGPVGTANLVFLHGPTRFENRAEDHEPQE